MFEKEIYLVEEIKRHLETRRAQFRSNMHVLTEVSVGYGIADLVIALYRGINSTRNQFLSCTNVHIFCSIERNPGRTIEEIVDGTRSSTKLIRKTLTILEDEGLIFIDGKHVYPRQEYSSTVTKSIAIEAKLKDWKRALKQAYRYKWFCESSYVCLPTNNITPAINNLDKFKQLGVGLVGISEGDKYDIIYSPKPSTPLSREMKILLNEHLLSELCSS